MYNINIHINVIFFFKKLPGEAGNVLLVINNNNYNEYNYDSAAIKTQFIFA